MKTEIEKLLSHEHPSKRAAPSAFFEALSDTVSDAVIITDKELIIEYWNKAASTFFEFIEDEAIGKCFSDLLFPGYSNTFFEKIIRQVPDKHRCDEQLITAKGQHVDCSFIMSGRNDSELSKLIIICKNNEGKHSINEMQVNDQRAKTEIILSERKLRSVLNSSIGAVFLLDTSYRILLANEKAKKIVRLARDGAVLKEGTYFPDLLPEVRREPVRKILDRVSKGEKIEYEVFYPNETGKGIWLLANYTPVNNEENKVNQICITAYNITHHKENEAALVKSEQRWKFAIEGTGDGVWEYNFETKQIYYSPLYKSMLGYTGEEFANIPEEWTSRVHPDDLPAIRNLDISYKSGSIVKHSIEYRLREKSGQYIWVLDRGMLLERTPEGNPLKLIGTHTNITERKIAEERLTQSEHRFISFMANTPTMTWIIDEYGVFHYLNTAYKRGFHLTDQAVGKSVHDIFPKDISDQFVRNNWKVFEMNVAIELTEDGIGPDGEKQVYHIHKFPLEPQNGTRLMGGVALDITKNLQLERHLAEEETRKKREIIQAIINAQEKEKNELAYELHDNVNQILSSAKLMLEVAAEKSGSGKDFTKRGLAYLQEAINEIRKISHNLTPASLRDISLEATIEDLIQSINVTGKIKIGYNKKIVTPKKDIGPEKQLAILRIIQEQFNNILKHSQATEAHISLDINETRLLLEIKDIGRGFNTSTTKRGLGLNNMFNRVEFYNGTIGFTSSPGKGCTLHIEIPL
jgi:PAS domain S-box-containing protein